jgi:hypothetical protein
MVRGGKKIYMERGLVWQIIEDGDMAKPRVVVNVKWKGRFLREEGTPKSLQ